MPTGGLIDGTTPMVAIKPSLQSHKIPRKPIARGSASTTIFSPTAKAGIPVTIDKTAHAETRESAIDPNERLIQEDTTPTPAQEEYVRWGVPWKTPLLIALWTLIGFAWAISHHLYYQSLNGTRAESSSRQHWAVRFGTALAFLVVASLRAACNTVYQQYIWTLFKRKTLSLDALDKLFSVNADPTAFVSWEFIKHAKIALLVALVCWCMPLAGVTPPATLSVMSGSRNESEYISLASIDWKSANFVDDAVLPSSEILRIATLAAESMAPMSPTSAAVNSSFRVQFFGPTVRCSVASGSQHDVFDNYTRAMANEPDMIATKYLFESGKLKWGDNGIPSSTAPLMNVYSAFSPMAGQQGWMPDSGPDVNSYNNWFPGYGFDDSFYEYFRVEEKDDDSVVMQQVLIQTADQAIVCTLGNASFDVEYEFVETATPLIQYSISHFHPLWTPVQPDLQDFNNASGGSPVSNPLYPYMAVYLAFSSLLNGNVSTTLTSKYTNTQETYRQLKYTFNGNVTIYDSSSRVLQHGLSACDDFKLGYWNGNGAIGIGQEGPVPWQQAAVEIVVNSTSQEPERSLIGDAKFANISNNLFTKPSWMCRNRTLLRAVEDLANNITISMLSSESLVKQNAIIVPVLFFSTENIYRYDSRNLILSYGIAAFFTIICACIGFFALHYNGVAHSTAFTAIVATTRNHELDAVSRGHSLGALPLQHRSMKVRFGELVGEEEGNDQGVQGRSGRHIGFGAADKVARLRKGGKYV